MAGVNREIRFNIRADVDQAIRAVTDLGREIDSQSGKVKADFDAQRFNDGVRESVGVLGDIDSAMQTLGSTLQIEGLQIVGDFFALGEGVAQLAGAMPELLSKFKGLSTTSIGAGLAIAGVSAALILLTDESRKASEAATAAANAEADAKVKVNALEDQSVAVRLERVRALNKDIVDLDEQATAERIAYNKAFDDAVAESSQTFGIFGDLLTRVAQATGKDVRQSEESIIARENSVIAMEAERDAILATIDVGAIFTDGLGAIQGAIEDNIEAINAANFNELASNIRKYTNLTEEEADRQIKILEDRLAIEQTIYDEAVRLYGEQSEMAIEASEGIDQLTASLEYMNGIDYTTTAANIESLGKQGWEKLGDIGSGLGGLFDKVKDNFGGFFEGAIEGAVEGAEKQVAEQEKIQQDWLKEQERIAKEQARLLEQEQRERERAMKEQERTLEGQLSQIENFERRKYEIEQGYRDATFQATLGNDVEAFLSAKRERRTARREERMFGTTINVNGLNVGALSTPEDIENAKRTIVDAMSQVMAQQAGKF